MVQVSTKNQRNIISAFIIIVVLVISSMSTFIIFYQPLTAKRTPTQLDVTVSMNQTNVVEGSNLEAEVNVTSIGNHENITLGSYSSRGIQCSFEPATSTSNFTSILTMSVPDSIPTGDYSVIVTASSGKDVENASYIVSILSANVTVSGSVAGRSLVGFRVGLSQINFIDTQTTATIVFNLSSTNPSGYSVTLQNEHTYNVSLNYYVYTLGGEKGNSFTSYATNSNFYAPAGNSTISGQNYNFEFP